MTILNKLQSPSSGKHNFYVLYHADSDGRYAGHCAFQYFERNKVRNVTYIEVQYGQPFPVLLDQLDRNSVILILDFSYVRDVMIDVSKHAGYVLVLDHHKGAAEELAGLEDQMQCQSDIVFNMAKSGALLAFEYFTPQRSIPWVCKFINDRDLWAKQYENSRYLESFIRKNLKAEKAGHAWPMWVELENNVVTLNNAIGEGKTIADYEDKQIDKVFKSKLHKIIDFRFNGVNYKACIYNCPGLMHSEIAEKFYSSLDVDLTIAWRVIQSGDQVLFSFRSPKRVDVSQIARSFAKLQGGLSGNGHPSAAGATMSLVNGLQYLAAMLTEVHQNVQHSELSEAKG